MYTLHVNGQTVTTEKKQPLLRFLRDELRLTSVKDGCSQGACGACTVIIDGETIKACVPTTDRLEGKQILTVEGLSDWEKQVFTYAYGEAGAVQCGFCIPGMVMCTKALLDKNPDPTEEEIRYALRNNYCRCTGYVKIIAAVRLAAEIMRNGVIPEKSADDWKLGSRVHRLDVEEKVLGYGKYPDDYYMDNMCYGTALRSRYPRARVLSIDTEAAKQVPGVITVLTAADIPGEVKVGHLKHDQYVMIPVGGLTHYLGDAIALVAAEDMETAEKAKKLIKVEYEVLPAVHGIEEAAAPDAPRVFDEEENNIQAHEHVSRGNAEEAIRSAKHVISHHFETPWTEHAFLEPECAFAYIDEDGYVKIISTDQSAYCTSTECGLMLGTDKVRAQNALVGGGFGGKEDMTVQPLAALITYKTGRPSKVRLTRAESLLIHPKRHHFVMDFTLGCDENGKILGVKAKVASDTGAFASLGGPVLQRACTHAAGPYAYENFEIDGTAYYIYTGASCIGQGLGTVLVQMIVSNTDLTHDDIVYERSNTWIAPDSGTTSGSRQTLVTGEACRRACEKLMEAKTEGVTLKDLVGQEFYGEYLAKTDPLGANVPNPVSHVAYGYATQMCVLDPKTGKVEEMVAAHDVGKAVNPLSCEGQIEGGVVMSMGFALREKFEIDDNCKPVEKYGELGLFRAHEIPKIKAIVVDKPGLKVACGAIGIGEITSIPTAPAITDAYYRLDGVRRSSLPITGTPYERK